MGASIFGNWPLQSDQLQLAKRQAELVGCATENVSNMIKCLRKTSAENLGKSIPKFRVWPNATNLNIVFCYFCF